MALNILRWSGDFVKLLSICFLLRQLLHKKDAHGFSRATLELLLAVHCLRYLDLWTTYYTFYNSFMKLFYIGTNVFALVVMHYDPVRNSVAPQETIRHWRYMCLPVVVLGFAITSFSWWVLDNRGFFMMIEACWTASILLEPVALIPQMRLYQATGRPRESLDAGGFLFLMGAYRALYVLNWIYRAHAERGYRHHFLVYTAGVVQAGIGLGATYFGMGTKGRNGCLWPHLVQWYRSTKTAWALTLLYAFFSINIFGYHYQTIDRIPSDVGQQRVKALLFMFAVIVLAVICYCGFSTHQEVPNDLSLTESLLTDNQDQEDGIRRPAKVVKKGIFVHGMQIV